MQGLVAHRLNLSGIHLYNPGLYVILDLSLESLSGMCKKKPIKTLSESPHSQGQTPAKCVNAFR